MIHPWLDHAESIESRDSTYCSELASVGPHFASGTCTVHPYLEAHTNLREKVCVKPKAKVAGTHVNASWTSLVRSSPLRLCRMAGTV